MMLSFLCGCGVDKCCLELFIFVKMYVSIVSVFVCSTASSMAYNSTLKMFGYPSRHAAMLFCSGLLNVLDHVMFPLPLA